MGEVYGSGSYNKGEEILIIAVPKENFEFVRWSDDSRELERKIVINEKTTLIAYFQEKTINLEPIIPEILNPNDYIKNIDDVLESNFNITSTQDKLNWKDFIENKAPSDLSNVDNYLLAKYNASLSNSYLIEGEGTSVYMGITQTISETKAYNGEIYFSAFESKGVVSSSNYMFYAKGSNQVISTQSTAISTPNTLSKNEYFSLMGCMPEDIDSLIISERTVISSTINYDNNSGCYNICLELDPLSSALLYYKQLKYNSKLEADPLFYNIKLTVTIDNKWNIISSQTETTYQAVKFGLGIKYEDIISYSYNFNCSVEIPI